jgi:predicted Zn-dependent peptidase
VGRVASELERQVGAEVEHGPDPVALLERAFRGPRPSAAERIPMVRSYLPESSFAAIDSFYRPGNALLVVAGDLELEEASALVKGRLAALPARAGGVGRPSPPFVPYAGPIVARSSRVYGVRVALGLQAPERESPEFLAFLVLDQLLLGGRAGFTQPQEIVRSASAPLARRLAAALGAVDISDGRSYREAPPFLSLGSPSYMKAVFSAPEEHAVAKVEAAITTALDEIRAETTDADIAQAKSELADFLSRWMLLPDLPVLGDLLAGFVFIDGDPARLNRLRSEIEAVEPSAVRALLDRYRQDLPPRLAVVLPESR